MHAKEEKIWFVTNVVKYIDKYHACTFKVNLEKLEELLQRLLFEMNTSNWISLRFYKYIKWNNLKSFLRDFLFINLRFFDTR